MAAAFTIEQITESARAITGNRDTAVQGDEYVSDEAIKAGLIEVIRECNEAFSANSGGKKEVSFWTTTGVTLTPPAAPTVTPDTSGGTLPAGTYGYIITALSGTGETLPGGEATATLGATGQMNISWTAVPYATGYNVYGRTAGAENFLKNLPAATLTWTDTGAVRPAGGLPNYNSTGGPTGQWLQDYDIATYVGTDVQEIVEVMRSDAYVSDSTLQPLQVDPRTGIPFARAAFVDQAYQQDALETMVAQARWNKIQDFNAWEIVNNTGSPALRLLPPPIQASIVVVRYISAGESVEDLPEDARPCMIYAACYCILDTVINRINSQPSGVRDPETARWYGDWFKTLISQRDRYENKYRQALEKRPKM